MNPSKKPIRMSTLQQMRSMKEYDRKDGSNHRYYGVTNWMVGTCRTPLAPWVQIHVGYFCIQIKWYLIVLLGIVISFCLGLSVGRL